MVKIMSLRASLGFQTREIFIFTQGLTGRNAKGKHLQRIKDLGRCKWQTKTTVCVDGLYYANKHPNGKCKRMCL